MIYQLLNYIFGWDYIAWSNSADNGVARVQKIGKGQPWYFRYKITGVVDVIKEPNQVVWLTCESDKYFPPNKEPASANER